MSASLLPILPHDDHDAGSVRQRLPKWLKRPLPQAGMQFTSNVIADLKLETVCESAKCPNQTECWSQKTATFMILGNVCTRPCGFCSVLKGKTETVQLDEPSRVAEAAHRLGLKYVVITSVTRDDLPDGGANHFYECVLAVRERLGAKIEVLTPDFLKCPPSALESVVAARPDVFNHNLETVPGLYPEVRPGARYFHSLRLLQKVKELDPTLFTKSGIMVGLGEDRQAVLQVMDDMRAANVDFLTVGQYLQPTPKHHRIDRFVTPDEFKSYEVAAWGKGFSMVSATPLTRSSYHAGDDFTRLAANRREKLRQS